MTLSTERGHLVLAVLQGIAAQIAERHRHRRRRPEPVEPVAG